MGWGVGNTVSKGGKVCVCVCVCGQGELGFAIKYLSSTCDGPAPVLRAGDMAGTWAHLAPPPTEPPESNRQPQG